MNSIQRILSACLGTIVILLAFQNCGQPGSLALKSQGAESTKVSTTADPGLIVGPVNTDGPPAQPLAAPLKCDTMGVSDISLNVSEVKAPSASGASSHLFEIITNDSAVGSAHKIVVRALHSARKIDKIDLEMAKTGSLMLGGNQQSLMSVSAAVQGHKIRLMLDRQDYDVTQGHVYNLSFKVDAAKQALKNTCEAKKCDSDKDDQDDEDDEDEHEGKKCVPKADECRLFLHLSDGSLKAGQ